MTAGRLLPAVLPVLALLAACSPQAAIDDVTRRAAETVVQPILETRLSPAQAAGVSRCVIDHATPAETRALARNVGTRGGTVPEADILAIAARPDTRACIAAAGLPHPAEVRQ